MARRVVTVTALTENAFIVWKRLLIGIRAPNSQKRMYAKSLYHDKLDRAQRNVSLPTEGV